jgi:TatA/E family protein of Tat protein translocase
MDILGIGPMELILILIVALAVFGPEKLPSMGAKLGGALRDMRKATRSFSEEIGAPARELMEPLQEVGDAVKSISETAVVARNPGEAIRQSVLKELKGAQEAELTVEPQTENRIAPPEPAKTPVPLEDAAPTTGDTLAAGDDIAPAPESEPQDAPPTGTAPDEAQAPTTLSDDQEPAPTDPEPES